LAGAVTSSLTWGIVVGLAVGKFLGVFGASALMRRFGAGEFGAGLTLDRIAGGGLLCGIGFTISLFIVDIAIDGATAQNEARVGVLVASVIAFVAATVVFRISDAVRPAVETGETLVRPVDPARDHVFGRDDAPYEIVEYGDFQCPFCLKASGSIDDVRRELGDRVRYVWRHAPLTDQHPNALAAAEAAE
ncbi:MAG TPA: sodium:proton antiporter, partial [Microbacterium sp.]|nr:sodium:proton antiporter [Microbacterium sp.]